MNSRRKIRAAVQYGLAMLRGEAGRYRLLPEALAFARLTPEEVAREQLQRLRALLIHADESVPYWRSVFAERGFEPRAVTRVRDLEILPLLTKEIIRREGDRLLSNRYARAGLRVRRTGGSTGEPLRFYTGRNDYEAQMTLHLRSMALVGVWPGDKQVKVWGYGKRQRGNLLAPLTGRLFFDAYDLAPETLDRWLRAMNTLRPKAIYGYTGALHQFARHAAGRGIPGLEFVFTTAEKLFDEQRRQIEEGLRARVIDLYGSHEVPRLASECLCGNMHAAPDAAVLEFLGDGDSRTSRLVVTSLQAWAMPLIRYDQGDAVRPGDSDCPCGLPFPQIAMEIGKVHHVFNMPHGRRLHSGFFYKPVFQIESLHAFQIHHVAPEQVEYLAVPRPGLAAEAAGALQHVCTRLAAELDGAVSVTYRLVDSIPRTRRGKQPIVVSHVPADHA